MLNDHQIADVLTTAANYIDDHGWLRFHTAQYSPPYAHGGAGAMSALGAIQNMITGSPSRSDTPRDESRIGEIEQVMACLDRRYVRLYPNGWFAQHGEPFMVWHSETDYPSFQPRRTKAEIVAFLRAAAGELRGDVIDGGHPSWACPECGEDVREFPPVQVPVDCPRQTYSHLDGEPLCPVPVVGRDGGSESASPVVRECGKGGAF
jgi:hypothetical protein